MFRNVYISVLSSSWPGLRSQKWSFHGLLSILTSSWYGRPKNIMIRISPCCSCRPGSPCCGCWRGSCPVFHRTQESHILWGKATTMAFVCLQILFCILRTQYMFRFFFFFIKPFNRHCFFYIQQLTVISTVYKDELEKVSEKERRNSCS